MAPLVKAYAPLKDVDSVMSILERISFLGGVTDTQRARIFRRMEVGSFKKGEYVSRRGEDGKIATRWAPYLRPEPPLRWVNDLTAVDARMIVFHK